MKNGIPLVVPEVNSDQIPVRDKPAIIANPNCSTIQLVVALKPISDHYGLSQVTVATYQSVSGADGSYTLNVTFALGTDPDIDTVNVQNRASLATALLPPEVSHAGLTIRKKSAALLQIINIYSPKNTYDSVYLSNYATINIVDTLARIKGVGQVSLFGPLDYSLRVWLDPERLAQFNLTPNDVIAAVQSQNVQAALGRLGAAPVASEQQVQLTIKTTGRLTTPEQFAQIVLRANPDGSVVRVKDVARV